MAEPLLGMQPTLSDYAHLLLWTLWYSSSSDFFGLFYVRSSHPYLIVLFDKYSTYRSYIPNYCQSGCSSMSTTCKANSTRPCPIMHARLIGNIQHNARLIGGAQLIRTAVTFAPEHTANTCNWLDRWLWHSFQVILICQYLYCKYWQKFESTENLD